MIKTKNKMTSTFRIVLALLMAISIGYSQNTLPKSYQDALAAPNKTDKDGKKQGKWSFLYNPEWKPIRDTASVEFYRLVVYRDGRIEGKVRDYYRSGVLQMEVDSVISESAKKYHGKGLYYHSNGKKHKKLTYRNGKVVSRKFYLLNGKVARTSWKSFYDKGFGKFNKGDYKGAMKLFGKAMKQLDKEFLADHYSRMFTCVALGRTNLRMNKLVEAEAFFLKALKQADRRFGKFFSGHLVCANNLALTYRKRGEFGKVETLYLGLLKKIAQDRGKNCFYYGRVLQKLSGHHGKQKNYAKAVTFCQQALDTYGEIDSVRSVYYGKGLSNLGGLYRHQRKYAKAEKMYLKAIEVIGKNQGEKSLQYAKTVSEMAIVYDDQGLYNKAEKQYLQAKKNMETYGRTKSRIYNDHLLGMSFHYMMRNRLDEAEKFMLEARDLIKERFSGSHPNYKKYTGYLAMIYFRKGSLTKQDDLFVKAAKAAKFAGIEDSFFYVLVLEKLAAISEKKGNKDKAVQHLEEALDIAKKVVGKNHKSYRRVSRKLAKLR